MDSLLGGGRGHLIAIVQSIAPVDRTVVSNRFVPGILIKEFPLDHFVVGDPEDLIAEWGTFYLSL